MRVSTHHGVQQGRQYASDLAKNRHCAYLEYIQNIMLQHQGEDSTGHQHPPYGRSVGKGNADVSLGHQHPPYGRSVDKENADVSLGHQHPPYGRSVGKGNADVSLGHQHPPYGRSVGQRECRCIPRPPTSSIREKRGQRERKGSPEHHFPPYGTPHTANMRVGKSTLSVKNKGGNETSLEAMQLMLGLAA
ncbi:hypothetical protein TNCV_2228761 [Trichonephila clavipes]|nr:hypothetical protein TNCV_2228761 [Trichonephila clavipes]